MTWRGDCYLRRLESDNGQFILRTSSASHPSRTRKSIYRDPDTREMSTGKNLIHTCNQACHLILCLVLVFLSLDEVKCSHHHGGGYGSGYGGTYGGGYGGGGYGGGGYGGGTYGGGGQGGAYMPPMVVPPEMWPEFLTRLAIGGFSDAGGAERMYGGGGANGFNTNAGFYDDLLAHNNVYDVGQGYGRGYDYGKGSVQGGGYRDLGGRNRGHTASGFSNSYKKDESGDRSSYYDDGLGHRGVINYGAEDNRFRDQGGSLGRGGFHDSNLNRYGTQARGRYGDALTYAQGAESGAHMDGGRYGYARHGRLLPVKNTGLYVIPMPNRLFFDQTPPPLK